MTEAKEKVAAIAAAFARQAELCATYGSPFYAALCHACADDVRAQGPVWRLAQDFALDPAKAALPLRVLGAVHALVLDGRAPALAPHYANAAATPLPGGELLRAFAAVVDAQRERLRPWLASPPQTNEVGRSGALLLGFLGAARAGLPLRVLELGASAGLNLRWDRFRYATPTWSWGAADATVVLQPRWNGAPPPRAEVTVAERRGCDLSPLDPRDAAMRQRLCAYVWPDRPDRLANLRAALDVASRDEVHVERADAADWLEQRLAEPAPGVATVVFHSSFWNHVPAQGQQRITAAFASAGARATAKAPLHWLRWEDEPQGMFGLGSRHELRLRSWPSGDEQLLAIGQPHGDWLDVRTQP